MASGGKKKTTMAKLQRETRLRERRADKAARKDARKRDALLPHDQRDPNAEGLELDSSSVDEFSETGSVDDGSESLPADADAEPSSVVGVDR
jgi:hypothetical protein